ncbi:NAD(+)/NADH kinase [Halorussus salilacus]|uniref:NAD(+)/NADH kinase n=1 Tax=Halorussus salilacus TaxID=2953750 RepID=UPI00209D9C75|nr:NAD(+)/NADH kinase [Halorussus salilacus]USZ67643.1 NAD(+)/NADH kinase [Halorussus salilacus]
MRVGIVAQMGNDRAASLAGRIREALPDEVTVRLDAATAEALGGEGDPVEEMDASDLVVSIGGDGTFLFAARGAGPTPILGVNLGEVGFLNGVRPGEAVETVESVVERFRETGEIPSRDVPRLCAETESGVELPPALNEIVVQGPQRGHGNGLEYEVRVDGRPFSDGHADGVLVSTPTGSTAYNLSEGGPLVHPEVDALVVTEMCAAESMPPLVVSGDSVVEIRADGAEHGFASSDSTRKRFEMPERVTVRSADEPTRIAEPASDFFRALGKLD